MTKAVGEFFETQVESYAENFALRRTGNSHQFQQRRDLVLELSRGCRGCLLDCATGTGEITAAVLAAGQFTAADLVDIAPSMLAHATELAGRTVPAVTPRPVVSDVFKFLALAGDEGRSYDLVLCLGLIAHTGRLDELFHRIAKVLSRPAGKLLLQSTLLDHWGTRIMRRLTARRYERQKGYAISYYGLAELRTTAQSCGLTLTAERRFGLSLPFGDKIWAGLNYRAECWGQQWAARHGAEVILAFEPTS